jgi:hypothetical protein
MPASIIKRPLSCLLLLRSCRPPPGIEIDKCCTWVPGYLCLVLFPWLVHTPCAPFSLETVRPTKNKPTGLCAGFHACGATRCCRVRGQVNYKCQQRRSEGGTWPCWVRRYEHKYLPRGAIGCPPDCLRRYLGTLCVHRPSPSLQPLKH